ncbi:MAG: amidohydrolase [Desulfobacterales bacterium]|nr:amidohydrolase [Desulfobacterales bacterium]
MRKAIDIHCHFNKFDTMPDRYTVHLIGNQFPFAEKHLTETCIKNKSLVNHILFKSVPVISKKFKYLDRLINSLRVGNFWGKDGVLHTLVSHGEYMIRRDYMAAKHGSKRHDVVAYTPLMMDFITAGNIEELRREHGAMPFLLQVYEHAVMSRYYPWQVFPFFHFHPEREGVVSLMKQAVEEQGFVGIKIYPAMGFYPDPADPRHTDEKVRKNLVALYGYIREMAGKGIILPITTHAQYSATQAVDLEMHETREFTDIANWKRVVRDYDLKINFGHYGGMDFLRDPNDPKHERAREFSLACREHIQGLMRELNNGKKRVFADCSAHSPMDDNSEAYIRQVDLDLRDEKLLLMYGTDLPVVTVNTLNNDYIRAYDSGITGEKAKDRFFMSNALAFLFEDGKIPRLRTDFLKQAYGGNGVGPDPADVSKVSWVKPDGQGGFRVDPKYL